MTVKKNNGKVEQPFSIDGLCPINANHRVQSRGVQIYCKDCDFFYRKDIPSGPEVSVQGVWKFDQHDDRAVVQAGTDEVIRNVEDLIRVCNIDTEIWQVDRHTVSVNSGYRKDRKSDWHVVDGTVVQGDVEDTGKILRVPLYNVKAWLIRKTKEIREVGAVRELLAEVKKCSIKIPKPKYKKNKDGCIYEIDIPDLHFGKLAWGEETGIDYDIKIAKTMVFTALDRLLKFTEVHNISQILIPWGNDFFNVDTMNETTTGGTPQQEDTRWKKTFREGRILTQEIIVMCSQIAPVDILFIPGNHDTQRLYFLGECISSAFASSKHINVDNGPRTRKYRHYDKVLLGFCHGQDEKLEKLPTTMSLDNRTAWSTAVYHEWHLGHLHTRKQFDLRHEEQLGCTIRYLSSLTGTDAWHFDNQFAYNIKAASAFLWHPRFGLQAEYHALGE